MKTNRRDVKEIRGKCQKKPEGRVSCHPKGANPEKDRDKAKGSEGGKKNKKNSSTTQKCSERDKRRPRKKGAGRRFRSELSETRITKGPPCCEEGGDSRNGGTLKKRFRHR